MKRSSRPRRTAELPQSFNRQLNAYALAAGAAGVSLLALTQPSEAKIIYTQTHARIVYPGVPLDLNHDGIVDFYLWIGGGPSSTSLSVCQYRAVYSQKTYCSNSRRGSNAIRKIGSLEGYAAALKYGAIIQIRGLFKKSKSRMAAVWDGNHSLTAHWEGPWANGGKGVKHRYLGLKFKIKGQFHFGWARLNVQAATGGYLFATLTGYAYETAPNKPIIAGKTKGPDVTTVSTASLGHLAAGACAIPAWRLKQAAATTH